MQYLFLSLTGISMGLFGGLLGIGGSIIMIPALVFAFGENQHLYQASAMICNFFVATAAAAIHKKAELIITSVIKFLIPAAAAGVIIGVFLSNTELFAGKNSFILARIFGVFLIYVIFYNLLKLIHPEKHQNRLTEHKGKYSPFFSILCGLLAGIPAGLLGIGGGVICVPAQQLLLKISLKKAISNSAATIIAIAAIGAFYKNATLPQHNINPNESLKIAIFVIPGAIVGAMLGGKTMHKLPREIVRIIFLLLAALACYKLLTVTPA